MKAKSGRRGKRTSKAEVTNVSAHGLWLLVANREHFLPFEVFPWFREASIAAALDVRLVSPGHLYWPELDGDLAIDSIEHPERFPLSSRLGLRKKKAKTRAKR